MRYSIYELATYAFDPLHALWERERTQRAVASVLVACFIAAIIGIELGIISAGFAVLLTLAYNSFYRTKT